MHSSDRVDTSLAVGCWHCERDVSRIGRTYHWLASATAANYSALHLHTGINQITKIVLCSLWIVSALFDMQTIRQGRFSQTAPTTVLARSNGSSVIFIRANQQTHMGADCRIFVRRLAPLGHLLALCPYTPHTLQDYDVHDDA